MANHDVTSDWTGGTTPSSTSSGLLRRIQRQDADAWERLVKIYGPLIYRWCRLACVQGADAADITQEAFRTVAARVAEFRHDRDDDTFRGWLATITRNKIGDFLRGQKTIVQAKGGSATHEPLHRVAEPFAQIAGVDPTAEVNHILHRALALVRSEFEESTWQAFWKVAAEGRSPADVAEELGLTRHAVYMAKSRVLCRLRQEMEGQSF